MTKRRAPLSLDAALARIAGQLGGGWGEMAGLAQRQERTVRNWGDPDTAESIPLGAAIVLDTAFQASGGEGAPLFECYALQLELACIDRFADAHALGRHAETVVRECGEAGAALIRASRPDATEADRRAAAREIEEALGTLKHALPLVSAPEHSHSPRGPPPVGSRAN